MAILNHGRGSTEHLLANMPKVILRAGRNVAFANHGSDGLVKRGMPNIQQLAPLAQLDQCKVLLTLRFRVQVPGGALRWSN